MTLMEQARELGVAIAASEEYQSMTEARHAVTDNPALNELLSAFLEKRQSLVLLLANNDFDRAEAITMSADIERMQVQLNESGQFLELLRTEKTFAELLHAVDSEINACIGQPRSSASCTHDCASCGGCRH